MKSDNTGAHLAWAATFNGEQDVYYSYIIPDVSSSSDEKVLQNKYRFFPNPSSDRVYIETYEKRTIAEIYSMTGLKIKTYIFNQNLNEIDISTWIKGVYGIKLTGNDGFSVTYKLIKE